MIEVVSTKTLLARPRYGLTETWWDTRTWWTRPDIAALAALCDARAPLIKTADALGRSPTSLVHKALEGRLILPREWRDALPKKLHKARAPFEAPLQYPYVRSVRGEHADLLAVNSLVPHGLPDPLRADVCQEIMLALWQKETTLEELRANRSLLRKFISRSKTENFEAGGQAISLDVPMRDGRSWYDVLPDPATL